METRNCEILSGLVLTVIIVFGTIGNILSTVVWTRGHKCKKLPGATYLTAIAISDTLALWLSAFPFAFNFTFAINLFDTSYVVCKLLHTTKHFNKLTSVWIIVSLTVTRTLAVCKPLKSLQWTNERTSAIVIGIIVTLAAIANIPWTIGATIIVDGNENAEEISAIHEVNKTIRDIESSATLSRRYGRCDTCQLQPSSFIYKYEKAYHNWFTDFVMLFTLPLIIVTISNILMLANLKHHNEALKTNKSHRHRHSEIRALTAWVITIGIFQLIAEGFWSISTHVPGFLDGMYKVEGIRCWYVVSVSVWFLNCAVNFLLYNLFGSAFRKDLKRFFNRQFKSSTKNSSSVGMMLSYKTGSNGIEHKHTIKSK